MPFRLTLMVWLAASSLFVAWPPQTAAAQEAAIDQAFQQLAQGRALAARAQLSSLLEGPEAKPPSARLRILQALLDSCIHSQAWDCVARYGPQYGPAAQAAPAANPLVQRERLMRAAYYYDYARFISGTPQVKAQILDWAPWQAENASNGELYIRRQLLAADILLDRGEPQAAQVRVNKVLSLIASAKDPRASSFIIAYAISESLGMLLEIGDTERAHGLLRAAGPTVQQGLPAQSLDAAVFHLRAADILQTVGDLKGAQGRLDAALQILAGLEVEPATAEDLSAGALSLKSALCVMQANLACAGAALDAHPFRARLSATGASPASPQDVAYLAARVLVAAARGVSDPAAARALATPAFQVGPRFADDLAVYRAAGLALASSPGAGRTKAFLELGRQLVRQAGRRQGPAGAWYRPDSVERLLIALALSEAVRDQADPELSFALFQLAGRTGPSFDADALTVLGQARTEAQRRAIHQLLRLKARRDRVERTAIQTLAQRPASSRASALLSHDAGARLALRTFDERIEAARRELAGDGVGLSGANLVALNDLRKVLARDEAGLAVIPTIGGLAYLCLRQEGIVTRLGAVDPAALALDSRLLQQALAAGHPPSDSLDSQYPVAAAVRLHDTLIRPFEGCLKPQDRIVWLPSVAFVGLPLAALLERPPPRLAGGYDLAAAAWLIRRHAISYAGSAGVLLATRSGARSPAPDFDFLGVGDPVLAGLAADGRPRGQPPATGLGAQIGQLASLPETRDELEASAKGFSRAQLLLGAQATEGRVRGEMLGDYRYLSFATHGLIRDDLQGLSDPALVLTPTDATAPAEDGLLTASEIADLNLKATFVALSACNTANFDLSQVSQDLPALASAFAVAGTPATLATLWPVDSETSKRVVSAIFATLRQGPSQGPSEALVDAQRAFLAAPPGRAYLHPRFWAPFVILGDGGAPPRRMAPDFRVVSVEHLSRTGGEVLDLLRTPDGVAARFISDPGQDGRHAGAVRLRDGAEAFSDPEVAALKFVARFGDRLVAAGYRDASGGEVVPVLQAFDPGSRAPATSWLGEHRAGVKRIIMASVPLGGERALLLVGDQAAGARSAVTERLEVLEFDRALRPTLRFTITPPPGFAVDEATATLTRAGLLLTFTQRFAAPASPPAATMDDYDSPYCPYEPVTWLHLYDPATGALIRARSRRGLIAVTRFQPRPDEVLLGGSLSAACALNADAKAVVMKVGEDLDAIQLYVDPTLGASEVRALAALPKGRILLAASKENVVDDKTQVRLSEDLFAPGDLKNRYTALLVALRGTTVAATRTVETAGNIYVDALETSVPEEILLGGSVGGRAAIIRLREAPR